MKKISGISRNVLITLLLLFLFAALLTAVFVWENRTTDDGGTFETSVSDTAASENNQQTEFLFVIRNGEGRDVCSVIFCSFDISDKTAAAVSFLPEIYLDVPDSASCSLGDIYAHSGADELNEVLYQNFGVKADAVIEFSFPALAGVIDQLGGVDIVLTEEEATYLNDSCSWALGEGSNRLAGEQALAYAVIEMDGSSFSKNERQMNVLIAVMRSLGSAPMSDSLPALKQLLDRSTSDRTDTQILAYAAQLYPILSDCSYRYQLIPADDTYHYEMIQGESVFVIDTDKNKEFIRNLLMGS